jgi:hypothetical protein
MMIVFALAALVLLPAAGIVAIALRRRAVRAAISEVDRLERLAAAKDRADRYLAGEDVYDGTDEEAIRKVVSDALRGERGEGERALAEDYMRRLNCRRNDAAAYNNSARTFEEEMAVNLQKYLEALTGRPVHMRRVEAGPDREAAISICVAQDNDARGIA